jgi:hypothetical protein
VRNLKAKEFVSEQATDLAKYGLTRPDYRVTVSEKDAPAPRTVLVARQAETGRGKAKGVLPGRQARDGYVAVVGGNQVFLVEGRLLDDLKTSPLDLRDKRLVAIETKDVKGIRLVWPEVTIAVEKEGDAWKLKEPQAADVESGKALDLLYSVSGLRFKDIATERPGDLGRYGLTTPQVEVIVTKTDNTDLPAIALGKADEEKHQLFAKVKDSHTIYILDPGALDDLPRDPARLRKETPQAKKD